MIPYKNKPNFEHSVIKSERHWYAEFPIGDAFSGPAYGDKEGFGKFFKAVVGVAAVVATGGAALGAFGALSAAGGFAAAGAALSASAVFSGVAFAGAALSLAGTVTGNQKLSKIGAIAGLAGGVGMLGTNIASAASSGAGFGESFSKGWADTVKQFEDGSKAGWDKLKSGLGFSQSPTVPTDGSFSSSLKGDATLGAKAGSGADLLGNQAIGPVNPQLPGGAGVSLNPTAPTTSAGIFDVGTQAAGSTAYMTPAAPAPGGGLISGAMSFAKSNPTALLLAGQTLAGAAQGRAADKAAQRNIDAQQVLINQQIGRANDIGYTYQGSPANVNQIDVYQGRRPVMPNYFVDQNGMIRRNMNA